MALSTAVSVPSPWWALAVVVAQAGAGSSLTATVARGPGTGSKVAPVLALVGGNVALLAALSSLDGRGLFGVPVSPGAALVAGGAAVMVAAVLAATQVGPDRHRTGRAELMSLCGVFVVPAALLVAGAPTLAVAGAFADGEVRVATYNVALALDGQGRPNLEHVARVLAEADADVIALQEVSRGYLPGGVDLVGWLRHSLDLPYVVFQPSAPGSLHGNAILSRHPIGEVEHHHFPRRGTALPRGAVAARIELPGGDDLWFINAHFPPGGSPAVRAARTEALLGLWGGRERTVVAADLNASAASDIVRRLATGGLSPTWDPTWGPGETYPAAAPRAQIDWVLTSADLEAVEGARHQLHPSRQPSDHLAVSVLVRLGS